MSTFLVEMVMTLTLKSTFTIIGHISITIRLNGFKFQLKVAYELSERISLLLTLEIFLLKQDCSNERKGQWYKCFKIQLKVNYEKGYRISLLPILEILSLKPYCWNERKGTWYKCFQISTEGRL